MRKGLGGERQRVAAGEAVGGSDLGEGEVRGVAGGGAKFATCGEAAGWKRGGEIGKIAGDDGKRGDVGGASGGGGEELGGVRVAGAGEERGGGAAFDDVAGVHDGDAGATFGRESEVVGDEQDGGAVIARELENEVHDHGLRGDVESGDGFVGEKQLRPAGDGERDHDALAHAAGEFEGVSVETARGIGNPNPSEQFNRAMARGASSEPGVAAQNIAEMIADRADGIEGAAVVLEDHGDVAAAHGRALARREGKKISIEQLDTTGDAGVGSEQTEQGEREDGLARAGLADEADCLARRDVEMDAVENPKHAAAGRELDGKVGEGEERGGHGSGWLVVSNW